MAHRAAASAERDRRAQSPAARICLAPGDPAATGGGRFARSARTRRGTGRAWGDPAGCRGVAARARRAWVRPGGVQFARLGRLARTRRGIGRAWGDPAGCRGVAVQAARARAQARAAQFARARMCQGRPGRVRVDASRHCAAGAEAARAWIPALAAPFSELARPFQGGWRVARRLCARPACPVLCRRADSRCALARSCASAWLRAPAAC
jgi:hypothetical protein